MNVTKSPPYDLQPRTWIIDKIANLSLYGGGNEKDTLHQRRLVLNLINRIRMEPNIEVLN